MASISVFHNGQKVFECDDPDVAIALQRRLEREDVLTDNHDYPEPGRLNFEHFWVALNHEGKRFLQALASHAEGIVSSELAKIVGCKPLALGRHFQYIQGIARQSGLPQGEHLVIRKKVPYGEKQTSRYSLPQDVLEKIKARV